MNRETEGLRSLSDSFRRLRLTLLSSSLLLTIFLSGIYLFHLRSVMILNLKITDIIQTSDKTAAPNLGVFTVAIDEGSLQKYGQWPWPRYRFAQLLEKITAAGAKIVGINIIFAERDRTSPQLWQRTLKQDFGYDIDTSGIPSEILDYDIYLANVLAKGSYVLGYTFLFNSQSKSRKYSFHAVPLKLVDHPGADTLDIPTSQFYTATGAVGNYQILADAASGSGFLNGIPDVDGVLRRLPLLIKYGGNLYPSFALSLLMQVYPHARLIFRKDDLGVLRLSLTDMHIPLDEQGNFLMGPASLAKSGRYSATDVLEGKIPPDLFKDRIVLVGLTAAGLTQEYRTLREKSTALTDIHRYALESLASSRHPIRTGLFPLLETGLSLLLCLLLAGCVAYFATAPAVLVGLLAIFCCWFSAEQIYQNTGYLFSPLLPTLSLSLGLCLLLMLKFHFFQQQAKSETGDTRLQLQSSETTLKSILNTIPDVVFRLDPEGNITFISPAISKYLKKPEALLGRSIFELVAPEDLEKVRYRLNERRTGDRSTHDLEVRLSLKSEANESQDIRKYFSLSAEGIYHPADSDSHRFLGTQGILRDITKRKSLEHQLMQAQKMEVIGNLAAGIAHDLNNILSGLVSYPDLLLLDIPKNDPLYKKIQIIQRSGKKAAVIVQDLLSLARLSVTTNDLCDLNEIISEYLESVEFQLIKKRHRQTTIHIDLQDNLLNVKGSSVHLSKVIMNLLNNALEAMPAGGDIFISTSNRYVDTHLEGFENVPEGEYVCVSITDSGVGIPQDALKQIFEPFYTKKSMHFSGTGLGMTIVWATIKDHKGYIDIQSEEGRGTTFKLYLPTTRENIPAHQRRLVLDDYLGSETILIVDDIVEQLDLAKDMLTKLGYTVYSATSGEKALETIKRHPVDLVILDMIMPGGLDGLETYQQIIRLYPRQKAIITSGFSESDRVKKLLQLGVGSYVQKPYTLEKLGMTVRVELDRNDKIS